MVWAQATLVHKPAGSWAVGWMHEQRLRAGPVGEAQRATGTGMRQQSPEPAAAMPLQNQLQLSMP